MPEMFSFGLDCRVIIDTVKAVLVREGISAENTATMEAFKGTKENNKVTWEPPY